MILIPYTSSLLLDNIGRLESLSNLTDDSDSDNYSDLSDTDEELQIAGNDKIRP